MSLHRSLKTKPAGLNQHRNVLKRAERIEHLANEDKFDPETGSPMGLPKVGSRKMKIAGKAAGADEESTDEPSEE
ncbi:MAG: small basic protein [Phycisphaerales bacterium]|jgi:small basic protein (TIGR04137 family)|nr:small basic protein [Phycisphaerales bacterium]|tara:strand:- start:119 stop:343 length:225 start_codon:yes stop_codon:yes gene_type:complete